MTIWTRSRTIGLAQQHCAICQGLGLRQTKRSQEPCGCVCRAIFRICLRKFRECKSNPSASWVSFDSIAGRHAKRMYSRKSEEFTADFVIVARRRLSAENYRLFELHWLLGAEWKACCRCLRIEKANFFYRVYAIEEQLGRAFGEVRPYSLFPIDEYFATTIREPFGQSRHAAHIDEIACQHPHSF